MVVVLPIPRTMCKYMFALFLLLFYTQPSIAAVASAPFDNPPVIDGDLSEWHDIPTIELSDSRHVIYKPDNWSGPDDLRANVRIANDSRFLYVAVEVFDDVVLASTSAWDVLKSDHVEVWIDLVDEAMNFDTFEMYTVHATSQIALLPDGRVVQFYPDGETTVASGTVASSKKGPSGYIIEASIDLVAAMRGEVGSFHNPAILVDVVDSDNPAESAQDCLMSLSPNRRWADESTFIPLTLATTHLSVPARATDPASLEREVAYSSVVDSARWYPASTGGFLMWREYDSHYAACYRQELDGAFSYVGDLPMGDVWYESLAMSTPLVQVVEHGEAGPVLLWVHSEPSTGAFTGPCSAGFEEYLRGAAVVDDSLSLVLDVLVGSCFGTLFDASYRLDFGGSIVVSLTDNAEQVRKKYQWKDGRFVAKD
jgi:hypothetical protein